MKPWKDKTRRKEFGLTLLILVLLSFTIYQQFLITDLQERMMRREAAANDTAYTDWIQWEASEALSENKEQQKDIYQLQKRSSDHEFRLKELEWDFYGKGK